MFKFLAALILLLSISLFGGEVGYVFPQSSNGAVLNSTITGSSLTSTGTLTSGATGAGYTVAVGTSTVTGNLPFANGGATGTATAGNTTGTFTVTMASSVVTITPSGSCTFNGTGGSTGRYATFVITTSGVSSFTLTWGTNFKTIGTLATGTTTAKVFCVLFICIDGTNWYEVARTTAM